MVGLKGRDGGPVGIGGNGVVHGTHCASSDREPGLGPGEQSVARKLQPHQRLLVGRQRAHHFAGPPLAVHPLLEERGRCGQRGLVPRPHDLARGEAVRGVAAIELENRLEALDDAIEEAANRLRHQVPSPRTLQQGGHLVEPLVPLLFNPKHGVGVLNKYLCLPKLVVLLPNPERVEDLDAAILVRATPVGVRLVGENAVPPQKVLVGFAEAVTGSTHTDVLDQPQVLHLVLHQVGFDLVHRPGVVRFDTPHVRRHLRVQQSNHLIHRLDKEAASCLWPLRRALPRSLVAFREARRQDAALGLEHELTKILEERVLVLVQESVNGVGHIAGVVPEHERVRWDRPVAGPVGHHKAIVPANRLRHVLQPLHVRLLAGANPLFIERGDDALALGVNQITNDLVVEEFDGLPLDTLAHVLILLRFESELNEKLLKLLVAVVNAELLKRVLLENFKAVNVEHANNGLDLARIDSDALVDASAHPDEESLVHGLAQRVAGDAGPFRAQVGRHKVALGHHCVVGERRLDCSDGGTDELLDGLGDLGIGQAGASLAVPLEGDVAEQEHRSEALPQLCDLVGRKADRVKAPGDLCKPLFIVETTDLDLALLEERVRLGIALHSKLCSKSSTEQLIEDVEIALTRTQPCHACLFKKVGCDDSTARIPLEIELDVHVFPEAGRVVVPSGLGVTKRLE
mmetsp:Transcript_26469/g.69624  ORF Transcript_26469/g.69624 Transcript_26469/m.69624 type:complete len:686 (-) Transcript_26469:554-2611(-)